MAALNVGRLEAVLGLDATQFNVKMAAAANRFERTGKKIQATGRTLVRGVTLPLVALGGVLSKLAADFDSEMTRIETLVGIQPKLVNQWRKSLLDLAPAVGIGPKALAQALFVVTSAGIRGGESLKVLENAAKAAAVGLGDTAQIARVVTSAVQAFASQGLKAKRATEILVATVREGNLEAEALAGSLGRVIGIAGTVGVTFAQVGGFIATFTRLGVSAEESTTALRSALVGMLKPGKEAAKELAAVGLSASSLRKTIVEEGLASGLVRLVGLFKANTEGLAKVIPNLRALSGVLGTAAAQGAQFIEIEKSIVNSTGILDEAFARVQRTTKFQFDRLRAQLGVVATTIGNETLPAVNSLLRAVTSLAGGLVRADASSIRLALGLGAIAASAGVATTAVGLLVRGLGGFAAIAAGLATGFAKLKLAVTAVGVIIAGFVAVFVAAMAAAGISLDDLRDSIVKKFPSIGPIIENTIHAVVNFMQRGMLLIVESVESMVRSVVAKFFRLKLEATNLFIDLIEGIRSTKITGFLLQPFEEEIDRALQTIRNQHRKFAEIAFDLENPVGVGVGASIRKAIIEENLAWQDRIKAWKRSGEQLADVVTSSAIVARARLQQLFRTDILVPRRTQDLDAFRDATNRILVEVQSLAQALALTERQTKSLVESILAIREAVPFIQAPKVLSQEQVDALKSIVDRIRVLSEEVAIARLQLKPFAEDTERAIFELRALGKTGEVGAKSMAAFELRLRKLREQLGKEQGVKALALEMKTLNQEFADLDLSPDQLRIEETVRKFEKLGKAAGLVGADLKALEAQVRDTATKIGNTIRIDITGKIADGIQEIVTGILRGTRELRDGLKIITDIWISIVAEAFAEMIRKKLAFEIKIKGNVQGLAGKLGALFKRVGKAIVDAFRGAWDKVLADKKKAEGGLLTAFSATTRTGDIPVPRPAGGAGAIDLGQIQEVLADLVSGLKGVFQPIAGLLGDVFRRVIAGISGIGSSFLGGFQNVLGQIVRSISGLFGGGGGGGGGRFSGLAGLATAGFAAFGPLGALGGLALSLAIPGLGEGGVITRPTLALVGESGREAVLPLDDLKGLGNDVIVQVFNSTGQPMEVKESRSSDGGRVFRVSVSRVVREDLATGGPISKAFQGTFGASPRALKR